MSNSTNTSTVDHDEFNLKHRITGAAVLLFFGALVIPWLLGPPSAASKQDPLALDESETVETSAKEIEKVLLGPNAETAEVPEETVYISKITPLDGSEQTQQTSQDTESPDTKSNPEADQSVSKEKEQNSSTKSIDTPNSSDSEKPESAQVKASEQSKDKTPTAEQREQLARENALKQALDAESASNPTLAISVGWVVQVGLFLEKSGAEKQMAALRGQGFTPHSTIVDTNRGPKTGTRVWLGPFEKRTEAETENKQLRTKTGKDGFIRVYP